MNDKWQLFLQQHGAVPTDTDYLRFAAPRTEHAAAAQGTVLVDLSATAMIRANGQDLVNFLQGQLSNDIRLVDESHTQLSAYSNPKGRMLAVFRIMRHGEHYLLQLPRSLRDSVTKRLKMYVLRSKVTLENADDLVAIGVSGPDAESLVGQFTGAVPEKENECLQDHTRTVIRLPGHFPRFELVTNEEDAERIWLSWSPSARACGASAWSWLNIVAGLPTVYPETSEAFVPQMANLELIGGVSFKKGCYPGQEIVARMQYLGRLKQRMYRVHAQCETAPRPGTEIYADDFGEQSAGTVVDAQIAPLGGYDMLAVVQIGSARNGNLHLNDGRGPLIVIQDLPYALPEQKSSIPPTSA